MLTAFALNPDPTMTHGFGALVKRVADTLDVALDRKLHYSEKNPDLYRRISDVSHRCGICCFAGMKAHKSQPIHLGSPGITSGSSVCSRLLNAFPS